MSKPKEVTAELEVVFEDSNGLRTPGLIYLGRPYLGEPGDWRCAVGVFPLYKTLPDFAGGDAFHALCAAIRIIKGRLQRFQDNGGRIYTTKDRWGRSDEQPFQFDLYFGFLSTENEFESAVDEPN